VPRKNQYSYSIVVPLPYNLKPEEIQIEDTEAMNVTSLNDELKRLALNIDGGAECERIMIATVALHQVTRHPMSECLRQAIIWERG